LHNLTALPLNPLSRLRRIFDKRGIKLFKIFEIFDEEFANTLWGRGDSQRDLQLAPTNTFY